MSQNVYLRMQGIEVDGAACMGALGRINGQGLRSSLEIHLFRLDDPPEVRCVVARRGLSSRALPSTIA